MSHSKDPSRLSESGDKATAGEWDLLAELSPDNDLLNYFLLSREKKSWTLRRRPGLGVTPRWDVSTPIELWVNRCGQASVRMNGSVGPALKKQWPRVG